jgi:hypothetical protein
MLFNFLGTCGTLIRRLLPVGGSRSGFWQNEKPHKFHKSAVLISKYVGFLEPAYHVYTTTNVGFDFGGECKS